ncbi:hypothetical protein Hanom_Chr03g00233221 [Helianthus anomalus]
MSLTTPTNKNKNRNPNQRIADQSSIFNQHHLLIITRGLRRTRLLRKQKVMNIRHDTTIRDGDVTKQLTQFLIIPHRQLNMPRHNSSLLVIPCRVSRQFQHLFTINFIQF